MNLKVQGLTHPNELFSYFLLHELFNRGFKDRDLIVAHPEAAKKGERYLGFRQMQSCYNDGDTPEHLAARNVMRLLKQDIYNPDSVILDIHNMFGANGFLVVGNIFSPVSLWIASKLVGTNKVKVDLNPTRNSWSYATGGILLEFPFAGNDLKTMSIKAGEVASVIMDLYKMDYSEVLETALQELKDFEFYDSTSIYMEPIEGHTDIRPITSETLEVLRKKNYEGLPNFTPIELNSDLRKACSLPDEGDLFLGSWGGRNMGPSGLVFADVYRKLELGWMVDEENGLVMALDHTNGDIQMPDFRVEVENRKKAVSVRAGDSVGKHTSISSITGSWKSRLQEVSSGASQFRTPQELLLMKTENHVQGGIRL